MTSRELVYATLKGENTIRVSRQLWLLPWAINHYKNEVELINKDYPDDIININANFKTQFKKLSGNQCEIGQYIDEWGCVFENIQKGVIGEVKSPLILDEDWNDVENIHIPEELLSFDIEEVNAQIRELGYEKFVIAGACPRPFEQLQFIRGTENFYMDLIMKPNKMMAFIEKMHDFYCRLLKKWALTDVDTLMMMDDWGSQKSLLINPKLWEEIFMPMYKDYIDIAHKAGKKMFMHSDGNILLIIPKLIDIGLDAVNCQLFCMGLENLKQFKGKITFWGEIDRQNILPFGTKADVKNAVVSIKDNLWDNGYCIAQMEFGPAAKPENIREAFTIWNGVI